MKVSHLPSNLAVALYAPRAKQWWGCPACSAVTVWETSEGMVCDSTAHEGEHPAFVRVPDDVPVVAVFKIGGIYAVRQLWDEYRQGLTP